MTELWSPRFGRTTRFQMTVAYDRDDMAQLIETLKSSPSSKDAIYSLTGDRLRRFLTLLQTVRAFIIRDALAS